MRTGTGQQVKMRQDELGCENLCRCPWRGVCVCALTKTLLGEGARVVENNIQQRLAHARPHINVYIIHSAVVRDVGTSEWYVCVCMYVCVCPSHVRGTPGSWPAAHLPRNIAHSERYCAAASIP